MVKKTGHDILSQRQGEIRRRSRHREKHATTVDAMQGALFTHRHKLQESLKKEYDASLAVLLPLKARLAATDRLIDQVVYRLYGLTEEEIAIVEGRSD